MFLCPQLLDNVEWLLIFKKDIFNIEHVLPSVINHVSEIVFVLEVHQGSSLLLLDFIRPPLGHRIAHQEIQFFVFIVSHLVLLIDLSLEEGVVLRVEVR